MVEGTGLTDLVPTLVVQSCCEYVEAAARLLNSASTDRKTVNSCILSAQGQKRPARVARLRRRS